MTIEFNCNPFKRVMRDHLILCEVGSDLEVTNLSLEKNEKPVVPVMGEFHFSRYPFDMWDEEIKKMKAGGVTIVSTYLFWISHEEVEGQFDFNGDKDINKFLSLCKENNMLVILRIGPWCHGEVIYGGFPEYIQMREDKRSSSPDFIDKVENLYSSYYEQVKDHFYQDGSVVIGIQLENEYNGKDDEYIPLLRELAITIGFKLPLYTITAGSTNGKLEGNMLPLIGRNAERLLSNHMAPLPVDNRFHIMEDKGMGLDILEDVHSSEWPYEDFPYMTCELGCGIQVTEHKRPVISKEDAYAVLMVQLAQGVNLPGYYMYHGGRNQKGGDYQERKKTGYKNNYPISSYDFQAPISEYGYLKDSYHKLKLLHFFLKDFGDKFAKTQSFFVENRKDELRYKMAVRMSSDGSGFVFVNNYQRLYPFKDIQEESIHITVGDQSIIIDSLTIPSGRSIMFPIHMAMGDIEFEYLIAQPICFIEDERSKRYYFFVPDTITCHYKLKNSDAKSKNIVPNEGEKPLFVGRENEKKVEVFILTERQAGTIWKLNNKVIFSENPLLPDGKEITSINTTTNIINTPEELSKLYITFAEKDVEVREYDEYLFSEECGKEYVLSFPTDIFNGYDDVKVVFSLEGNVAQLYCGNELEADWFNYDNEWTIGLRRFREKITIGEPVFLRVSPVDEDRFIYFEKDIKKGVASLSVKEVTFIKNEKLHF